MYSGQTTFTLKKRKLSQTIILEILSLSRRQRLGFGDVTHMGVATGISEHVTTFTPPPPKKKLSQGETLLSIYNVLLLLALVPYDNFLLVSTSA